MFNIDNQFTFVIFAIGYLINRTIGMILSINPFLIFVLVILSIFSYHLCIVTKYRPLPTNSQHPKDSLVDTDLRLPSHRTDIHLQIQRENIEKLKLDIIQMSIRLKKAESRHKADLGELRKLIKVKEKTETRHEETERMRRPRPVSNIF